MKAGPIGKHTKPKPLYLFRSCVNVSIYPLAISGFYSVSFKCKYFRFLCFSFSLLSAFYTFAADLC
ncbi:MAG TPA: hypothetical protein DF409_12815 [Bacteroidales bacterium]|nr:hypothetical protein [Bacteroidales bacterium]